ncbi:DNA damage-regulated autophagy modulator protein 1-like isoform X2 [Haliotis cracherodii]|uniref:DNA damage-regulated autophagy modulator protein 1-like isoform X2 n=1 Tax=Haliotis cracherodii TaxID=6455 RepID=UPI0039EB91F2
MIGTSKAMTEGVAEERRQILDSPRPPRSNGTHTNEEDQPGQEDMAFCMMLMRKKVHFFPVFTWIFIIVSFFICYGIAVAHGHVEPDFPYISYTAIKTPERCYFSQLINFGACLLAGNVFIRYLQMKEVFSKHNTADPSHRRLNIACLVVGFLSALGFSMVANFQTQVMRPLHYTGAGLAFVFGMCYCWMSSALTWKQRVNMNNTYVAVLQLINSVVLTVFLVVFGVSKAIYKYKETHGMGTKWDTLKTVYLLSTITEWLTATFIVTFVLTYYPDFKKIRFYGPRVKFNTDVYPRSTASNGDVHVNADGLQGNNEERV